MTKKYWAALAIFCFTIALGSAVFLYQSLKNKTGNEVPLKKVVTEKSTREEKKTAEKFEVVNSTDTVKTPSATEISKTAALKTAEPDKPKPAAKNSSSQTSPLKKEAVSYKVTSGLRNIGFSYHNMKAKEVFITGSFNDWSKQALYNKGKIWAASVQLAPGTYQYQFIVDGKKIPDPNNKKISSEGKSILTVKPLGSK